MRPINILLNNVLTPFMLFNDELIILICFLNIHGFFKDVIHILRKKYTLTLTQTIWLYNIRDFSLSPVVVILNPIVSQIHPFVWQDPSLRKEVVLKWELLLHSH